MIGILSDAHGNKPAFDLAIEVLASQGADKFVFLGDALGYLPTSGVLDSIAALGEDRIQCIRGNHEDMILSGHFSDTNDPVYQHRLIRDLLSPADLEQIGTWPRSRCIDLPTGGVLFVHGSPIDPTFGYVYPDADLSAFAVKESIVFMGHTHRPFDRRESGVTFVNVGSCGLPRDHGSLGSAALLDEATGAVKLVRFDIRRATNLAFGSLPEVHPSVHSMLLRQPTSYEGVLLET